MVCFVSTMRPRAVRGPGRCGPRCQNSANAGGTPSIAAASTASPLKRNRTPKLASQVRVAFASMAWNTGLQVARRTGDYVQHLRGRGLLQQRFAQLVEQARILDRDDGLTGEVCDQLDLLLGEWPDVGAIDCNAANRLILPEHRH